MHSLLYWLDRFHLTILHKQVVNQTGQLAQNRLFFSFGIVSTALLILTGPIFSFKHEAGDEDIFFDLKLSRSASAHNSPPVDILPICGRINNI